MEANLIKEFGIVGSATILLFFIFKKSIEETLRQNNGMMTHLMETNKQLHSASVDVNDKFNATFKEHTKAIHELREEIRRMNEK